MKPLSLLFLLFASSVWAQQAETQVIIPYHGAVREGANTAHAAAAQDNDLYCVDFIPPVGITSATKVAWMGGDISGTFGIALYENDGSNRLFSSTVTNVASSTTLVTNTVSSFTMWAGTRYRFCWCAESRAGVGYRSASQAASHQLYDRRDFMNAFGVNRYGVKEAGCSAGVPPTTATGLTTIVQAEVRNPPIVALGK